MEILKPIQKSEILTLELGDCVFFGDTGGIYFVAHNITSTNDRYALIDTHGFFANGTFPTLESLSENVSNNKVCKVYKQSEYSLQLVKKSNI